MQLPQEILDLILENYSGDWRALGAYSLVAKPWLRSARYHLFGDLTLHLGGAHEARFLALLNHPLCTFALAVRKMWVLPMQERALAKDVDATLTQLAKLTGVRTLRLHRQKIIPACTLAVLAASFQGVTELVMMLRFPAQADALGFVCAFPALEALHFECVRTPPGEVPPAELRLPVGLRSVVLHGVRGHERWFADNRVEHLAELSVEKVRAQEDKARLDELLALFGAGLRRLTLRFEPLKNEDEVTVDLRHSTALRVLELDLSALTRKHIFPALASLRAPHIERIVWRNRRVLGGDAEVWAGLDALLVDQEAFPALTKFEVVAGKGRGERLNPRLWMPRCKARGILGGEVDIILSF